MSTQADSSSLPSTLLSRDYLREPAFPNTPAQEAENFKEAWDALKKRFRILTENGWQVCVLGQPDNVDQPLDDGGRGMVIMQGWNLTWALVRDAYPEEQPEDEWMDSYRELLIANKGKKNEAERLKQEEPLTLLSPQYRIATVEDSDPSDSEKATWMKKNGWERSSFWGNPYREHSVFWSGEADVSYTHLLADPDFAVVRRAMRGRQVPQLDKLSVAFEHLRGIALSLEATIKSSAPSSGTVTSTME